MKRPLAIFISTVVLTLGSGCTSMTKKYELPEDLTLVPDQRPRVCTKEYRPVEGFKPETGEWQTYANKCVASKDPAVAGYRPVTPNKAEQ